MKLNQNMVLLILAAMIAAFPLVWLGAASFGGADDKVKDVVAEVRPGYEPWVNSWWKPPSPEVESFLFALQAALGAGFLGYWIGYHRGRRAGKAA